MSAHAYVCPLAEREAIRSSIARAKADVVAATGADPTTLRVTMGPRTRAILRRAAKVERQRQARGISVSCPDCDGAERAQDEPLPRSDLDAVDAVRAEVAQIEEAT